MQSPGAEYARRLDARRGAHARFVLLDARLAYARLAVFGAGLVIAWLAFVEAAIPSVTIAIPIAAFIMLMRRHDPVIRGRDTASRAAAFYERGIARIEDRWAGGGEPGDRFRSDDHLYANDLDLFGRGSLFELLTIARTRTGEERLAAWLQQPAGRDDILGRQTAVAELAPQLDLRESLVMAGTDVRTAVDTTSLAAWAAAPPVLRPAWPWAIAALLSTASVASAVVWVSGGPSEPFVGVLATEVVFFFFFWRRVVHVLHAAEQPARDLDVLAYLLAHLERARFKSPLLVRARTQLDTSGVPASTAIRQLHWMAEAHHWQHNQVFAPIAATVMWGTHLAFAMERWRCLHGAAVARWLDAAGEFEAFNSLSAYRFEHPDDPFPEIAVDTAPVFEGAGLGHPLIAASRLVRNDVSLGGDLRLYVISGSNMSGKSTLLRTVGINAVLAQMGAPVRAARLRLTPLAIGGTLRIQDSLQEGRSRFYAEITRLRRLVDLSQGPLPLLFLLDELFHGTNSHDRLVGASGVLKGLLDRGAIGLITTHDLALTAVAAELAPRAVNVHFEDRFENGEIAFDYRMRPGPVTRSNALALMRAVGLDVP